MARRITDTLINAQTSLPHLIYYYELLNLNFLFPPMMKKKEESSWRACWLRSQGKGWRDGSRFSFIQCSSQGLKFSSQSPCWEAHSSLWLHLHVTESSTPTPDVLTLFFRLCGYPYTLEVICMIFSHVVKNEINLPNMLPALKWNHFVNEIVKNYFHVN